MTKELRGEARNWYRFYENITLPYSDIRARFLDNFDNASIQTQLMSKLYGRKHTSNQSVAVFIAEQWALAQRLCPFMGEEEATRIILQGIIPEIRTYLALRDFRSPEELNNLASEIERNLQIPRRNNPFISTTSG